MASDTPKSQPFDDLYVYAMDRPGFILQHVVDAYAAQTADETTKPIKIVFGLLGLFLHLEKGYAGRPVQLVHMKLANQPRKQWPAISLPLDRGGITVEDVMAASEGAERDAAIDKWCASVWTAYQGSRHLIIDLLREHNVI